MKGKQQNSPKIKGVAESADETDVQSNFSLSQGDADTNQPGSPSFLLTTTPPAIMTSQISIGSLNMNDQIAYENKIRNVGLNQNPAEAFDRDIPNAPLSSDDSASFLNRYRQYFCFGKILLFLANLIELTGIGYGIYLYRTDKTIPGVSLMATFGTLFIATVIVQCCLCKYARTIAVANYSNEHDERILQIDAQPGEEALAEGQIISHH